MIASLAEHLVWKSLTVFIFFIQERRRQGRAVIQVNSATQHQDK